MATHLACQKQDCTVAQTGRCLLNNDPATCPERSAGASEASPPTIADAQPLQAPASRPRFFPGLALDLEEATRLMARRYTHVIGVLGTPDAGKTAALVSLYLLLANAKLPGFSFADSDTVMALDALSRGARKWNKGVMPEQMTGHTELGNDRSPGFLHLRVRSQGGDRRKYDLLFPDLPGEWTTQLIDKNVHERFSFLARADAFWVVADGNALLDPVSRNHAVHRTSVLLDRIRQFTSTPRPRVCLVLTRRDSRSDVPSEAISRLSGEAERLSLVFEVFEVASFSDSDQVAPGSGLDGLLQRTLAAEPQHLTHLARAGTRQFLRYRK